MSPKTVTAHMFGISLALAAAVALAGCAGHRRQADLASPYPQPVTIAMAPVMNLSGTGEVDTLKITDVLYSELQQCPAVTVVPVNRTLAEMAEQQIGAIQTPEQAVKLARGVGADLIIVWAITEYVPYYPPIVGVTAQIFAAGEDVATHVVVDPVALQRLASPIQIAVDQDRGHLPKNQLSRIYNARIRQTVEQVKRFAAKRNIAASPYQWQRYLRSQEYYLRFVCHESLRELFDKEADRLAHVGLSDAREYH